MQYACAAGLGRAGQVWITQDVAVRSRRRTPAAGLLSRRQAGLGKLAAAAAVALALVVSTGPTLVAAAAPVPPTGPVRFLDHHGPVLRAVQLYLIYWGTAWTAAPRFPSPAADEITTVVRTMMASSYLTDLAQYRGVGRGLVRGSTVISASDPPHRFTDGQVSSFLNAQIDAGTVPGPDADNQTVYGVLMPAGVKSGGSGFGGEHSYYTRRGRRIHFVWAADSSSLARTTRVLSHEVVEAATDPEGSGFRGVAGACNGDGWCEIADVCSATTAVDGVTVLSYWSNHAGRCVVPASESRLLAHPRGIDGGFTAPTNQSSTVRPVGPGPRRVPLPRVTASAEAQTVARHPGCPAGSCHARGRRHDDDALRSDNGWHAAQCVSLGSGARSTAFGNRTMHRSGMSFRTDVFGGGRSDQRPPARSRHSD